MKIKVGSDFSGVGAFDQALIRLGIDYDTVFACDKDKYARATYIANYGNPKYYPTDVYEREIPKESLDIYMTSPPCQSFSLAGKRLGKDDKRGILFFNSHEFIKENKPRYFIFENVKGLMSDNNGKTFSEWLNMLGGKSINGNPVLFPYEDSVPYHIYYKVLNAKDYGVPQNRERIFIVGIRDDKDNNFRFPKEEPLTKRLKDVLESVVEEKYYLTEKTITYFKNNQKGGLGNGRASEFLKGDEKYTNTLLATYYKTPKDAIYIEEPKTIVALNLSGGKWDNMHEQSRRVYDVEGIAPTMNTCGGGNQEPKIIQKAHGFNKGSENEICPTITINAWQENNLLQEGSLIDRMGFVRDPRIYDEYSPCIRADRSGLETLTENRIRKLTPTECFRLMDFPDTLVENARKVGISNSQLYKQAGNSIVVAVLEKIIKNLLQS